MKRLGPLIWPCLEKEKERRKEKEREKKNENEFKDDIRSLKGLKTERQSMQKLEESC